MPVNMSYLFLLALNVATRDFIFEQNYCGTVQTVITTQYFATHLKIPKERLVHTQYSCNIATGSIIVHAVLIMAPPDAVVEIIDNFDVTLLRYATCNYKIY